MFCTRGARDGAVLGVTVLSSPKQRIADIGLARRGTACCMAGALLLVAVHAVTTATSREPLLKAADAFDAAQFRQDAKAMVARLASDMIYINSRGRIGTRRDFVAAFVDTDQQFDPFVIRNRNMRMLDPDVGVVTADGEISGRGPAGQFRDRFRYSDVFAYRQGRWQVVYVQVTRLVS